MVVPSLSPSERSLPNHASCQCSSPRWLLLGWLVGYSWLTAYLLDYTLIYKYIYTVLYTGNSKCACMQPQQGAYTSRVYFCDLLVLISFTAGDPPPLTRRITTASTQSWTLHMLVFTQCWNCTGSLLTEYDQWCVHPFITWYALRLILLVCALYVHC